jgi:methylmalonyl-CoA mutase
MMTRRDPYVNILRATIATFAAGIGGADAITVLPFTLPLGLPDRAARRIARNTQLILIEESSLAKVADPAAGAGALEALTEQIGRAAWALFQEIERAGGAAAALARGLIQEKVAAVRAQREAAVARRIDAITGTSEFPDLREPPVSVLDVARANAPSPAAAVPLTPLTPFRLAEPFEQLRDASDRRLALHGSRPKVFLANLGGGAEFTPRATFAKNFFEAGGIEAAANEGFVGQADIIAAFKRSGALLACLCGTDASYAREGVTVAHALRAAGARRVYLAGALNGVPPDLAAAGVRACIHPGCDALAILRAALQAAE